MNHSLIVSLVQHPQHLSGILIALSLLIWHTVYQEKHGMSAENLWILHQLRDRSSPGVQVEDPVGSPKPGTHAHCAECTDVHAIRQHATETRDLYVSLSVSETRKTDSENLITKCRANLESQRVIGKNTRVFICWATYPTVNSLPAKGEHFISNF